MKVTGNPLKYPSCNKTPPPLAENCLYRGAKIQGCIFE